MKNKILIFALLVTCNLQFATFVCYSQTWEYSSVIQSGMANGGVSMVIDNSNNIYIGSSYRAMVAPINFMSDGYNDAFIAKYNSSGSIVWVKNWGGNNPYPSPPNYTDYTETITCLYVDNNSNYLYASGTFYGTTQFGNFTLTSFSSNSRSRFLIKLSFDGEVIWAKRMTGNISGMVSDDSGNLFFCGSYAGTVIIDSVNTFPACGYIVKFDANGNCIWAKNKFRKVPNSFEFTPTDIKLHHSDIIINGYTNNDTILIDTVIRYLPLNSKFSALSCFSSSGDIKWLNLFGGNNSQGGWFNGHFSLDQKGNSYSTGYFTGIGYFGNDTLSSTLGQQNMFLAKHDSLGHLLWTKQINAASSLGNCVSNVVDSTLYVSGWFKGTAHFNDSITAGSAQDMFLAKYNTNGVCLGVQNFGKAEGQVVVQDYDNAAYVSGLFYSNINIGSNSYNIYNYDDIFLAKLSGNTSVGNANRAVSLNNLLTIYSNPNTGKCNITIPEDFQYEKNLVLNIFDTKGVQVQQAKIEMLEGKIKLNIEAEAKGIYTAVLTNGKKNYTGKIIFE